jgi:hypothetical protein
MKAASQAANALFEQLEKFPVVDASNKDAILQLVGEFISVVDGIIENNQLITLDGKTLSQARRWLFVAQGIAQGIRIAVASVQQPTPLNRLLIDGSKVRYAAAKASQGFTDEDAALVNDIVNIGVDFFVKLKAQSGQTTEWLREKRRQLFNDNQVYFDQQLQRRLQSV